jgi:hypothetical protein
MTPLRSALVAFLVALAVVSSAMADADYSITDGSAELTVSIDPAEAMVWLNTFPVDSAGPWIDAVRVAYGRVGGASSLNGLPVTILLYEDTNGGSPQDAVLRWSFTTVIANANTNVLNVYALPAMSIHGNLVVGAVFANTSRNPKGIGALDVTAPTLAGRSYFGFATAIDPANLAAIPAAQWGTIESFGTNGNFRVEAHGRATVDDGAVALGADRDLASASVHLTWTAAQATFSVERASRPDFSDGTILATGVTDTFFDDPTLDDGTTWFYRVR